MYSLLTIDLDDTVWPCRPTIMRAEQLLFGWLQAHAQRVTEHHDLGSLRQHRQGVMREKPEIAHDLTAVRIASLEQLLIEFDYDPGLAVIASQFFLQQRNRVTPFADVFPVLQALRKEYFLVSVTNGNANVERTPLRGCFHYAFTAAEVGAAKPEPQLFQRAMAAGGAVPAQSIHVGDDPELDVAAARELGMTTVWVNRDSAPWPADLAPPNVEVRDFFGLADWISG